MEQMRNQWAKVFYKNRLPFKLVEDSEFKKAVDLMRPGMGGKLPTRRELAGKYLDREHSLIDAEMKSRLEGKNVVLSQDGWSNIHRQPIIASCIHILGKTFLHDAVDVKDEKKDAKYCAELAKKSILEAEEKYACRVIAFVSDNEAKMVKVREILQEWRGNSFMVYGCGAHYVNLMQSNATPPPIKSCIKHIQKFFRNHHSPAAKLKKLGGRIPQLPNETRWLSQRDFFETFLFNYKFYIEIHEKHPTLFTPTEDAILNDRQIKRAADHLLEQLNEVAKALNIMQSDHSSLADAMEAWITLTTHDCLSEDLKEAALKRMEKAITPYHAFAKLVSNKPGKPLPLVWKRKAHDFIGEIDEEFLGLMAAYETGDESHFPPSAFKSSVKKVLEPVKYWKFIYQNTEFEPLKRFCTLAMDVLSCVPSSAGTWVKKCISSYKHITCTIHSHNYFQM